MKDLWIIRYAPYENITSAKAAKLKYSKGFKPVPSKPLCTLGAYAEADETADFHCFTRIYVITHCSTVSSVDKFFLYLFIQYFNLHKKIYYIV